MSIEDIEGRVLEDVRALAAHYSLRVEVSSDSSGVLGRYCVTISNFDRSEQAFGPTVALAVSRFQKHGRKPNEPGITHGTDGG
jgi:hypothetical protein